MGICPRRDFHLMRAMPKVPAKRKCGRKFGSESLSWVLVVMNFRRKKPLDICKTFQ